MSTIGVGLSPEQFTAAFPFHFVCDADLRVVQAGPSLRRIFPQMCDGARLAEHFRIARPRGATTYTAICQQQEALFILEPLAPGLTLRGQMLPLPESRLIAFLGAPSATWMSWACAGPALAIAATAAAAATWRSAVIKC